MPENRPAVPYTINISISAFLAALNLFQFILLPLFVLPMTPVWGFIVIPAALFNNTLWYLVHESFHRNLLRHAGLNRQLGSLMCCFHGGSWTFVRFCHLMHHRFNRSMLDRPEAYESSSSWLRQAPFYYFRLLGGLYWAELILPLFFFFKEKRVREITGGYILKHDRDAGKALFGEALKGPLSPEGIRSVRMEYAASCSLFGLSLILYGKFWPFLFLLLSLRALVISITDNLPHYGTRLDTPRYARNLCAPSTMRFLLMNFNFHGIHHLNPGIPWTELPSAFEKQCGRFDDSYLRCALRQLAGPIPAEKLTATAGSP